jgi:hypothetical protein
LKTLIVILLFSTYAHAFRLSTNTGAAFNKKEVKVSVTSNSVCTQAGISKEELLNIAIDGAKKFWNKVPTSNLRIKSGGIYSTTDSKFLTEKLCASDSSTTCPTATSVPQVTHIVIACNSNTTDNFPSSSYLALSGPTKVSSSTIEGSIILINDSGNSIFNTLSRSEMVSVLAHEIGHAIGLGHSNKDEALMYYQNSDKMHRLSQDDIDGVTYLYPNKMDGCGPIASIFGGSIKFDDNDDSGNLNFLFSLVIGLSIGFLWPYFTRNITLFLFTSRRTRTI